MSLPLDYYSLLGVSRSASDSDLRSAYRAFSLTSHPSASGASTQAEKERFAAQFKLVSEAFDVLSHPERRAIYDQFGEVGLKNGVMLADGSKTVPYAMALEPEALFLKQFGHNSPFFEAFRPKDSPLTGVHAPVNGHSAAVPKAASQEINFYVSLEEFYSKSAKKVKILRNRLVAGGDPAVPVYSVEERYLNVEIGDGWKDGTRLTFPGEGDEEAGKSTGDIILVVKEKPHPTFRRRGADLLYTANISLLESLTGCTVHLNTLDGRALSVPVSEIVSPAYEQSVNGEGFPKKGGKERGNLVIQFQIRFPDELSLEQKNGLKRLLAGL